MAMYVCWVCAEVFPRRSKLEQHEQSSAHTKLLIDQVLSRESRSDAERRDERRRELAGLDEDNRIELSLCVCTLEWRVGRCQACIVNMQWSEASLQEKLLQTVSTNQSRARDSRARRTVLSRGLSSRTDVVSEVEFEKKTYDNRGIIRVLKDAYQERKETMRIRQSTKSLLLPSSQRSVDSGQRLLDIREPKALKKAKDALKRMHSTVKAKLLKSNHEELSIQAKLERSPLVASSTRKKHISSPPPLKQKLLNKIQVSEFVFT